MNEIVITKDNFDEEVRNYKGMPILLDFWASWCGPCMMLAPVIEEIADEYAGKIKVGSVNVDEQPELAERFGISSIPCLIVFKGGSEAKRSVGVIPKAAVLDLVKNV